MCVYVCVWSSFCVLREFFLRLEFKFFGLLVHGRLVLTLFVLVNVNFQSPLVDLDVNPQAQGRVLPVRPEDPSPAEADVSRGFALDTQTGWLVNIFFFFFCFVSLRILKRKITSMQIVVLMET